MHASRVNSWLQSANFLTQVLLNKSSHFPPPGPLPGSSAPVMTASMPPVAPSALEAAETLIKLTLPLRELWITCPATEKGVQIPWQPSIPSRSWNKRVSRTKSLSNPHPAKLHWNSKTWKWLWLSFKFVRELISYLYLWAITSWLNL